MSRDGKAATDIRNALRDARSLCEQLGLAPAHAKRQRGGYIIRCVAHTESDPSCSVSLGPDGTVRVRCFSCGWTGDALSLIAQAHGLELRGPRFREVLILGAELAGLQDLVDALRRDTPYDPPVRPPPPRAAPPDEVYYPDAAELRAFWSSCVPITEDEQVAALLTSRALSVDTIRMLDLARALPVRARPPRWASYHGSSWTQTGHRLILPVYDYEGIHRSVRGWRVVDNDTPKRLPPGGHKAAELVLANGEALTWLRHSEALPYGPPPMPRLTIVEGEPDFLVRATLNANDPVVGLLSGAWHVGYAVKIPTGSAVYLYTHRDRAGDKYADEVARSIRNDGIQVHRLSPEPEPTPAPSRT